MGIGLLFVSAGCGNYPLVINRDVVVQGQVSVTGDVHLSDDLIVADDIMAGGDSSVAGDINVGDDVNIGGDIIEIPPPSPPLPLPPPSPSPPPPPPLSVCGNGIVESGEQCDGLSFNGQTCLAHGFDGGTLLCLTDCTVNFSQCTIAISPLPPQPPPPPPAISATIVDLARTIQSDRLPVGLSIADEVRYDLRVLVSNGRGETLVLHYLLYDNTVSDLPFVAPIGAGEVIVTFVRNPTVATPSANDCFQVRKAGVAVSLVPATCFPIIVAGSP